MKVYLDRDFKCHTTNPDGNFREVDFDYFHDKCDAFIEGFRYVPDGEEWTDSYGNVHRGKMLVPWKNTMELDKAQWEYEQEKLAEYEALINELYAEVTT